MLVLKVKTSENILEVKENIYEYITKNKLNFTYIIYFENDDAIESYLSFNFSDILINNTIVLMS